MAEGQFIRCNSRECSSCEELGRSKVNCYDGINSGIDTVPERFTLNDPCHYEHFSPKCLSSGPCLLIDAAKLDANPEYAEERVMISAFPLMYGPRRNGQ